jgi:hypothetical protein
MKYFSKCIQPPECFICCTKDGKSDNERFHEMILGKRKTMGYPIISLSYAYGCCCHTSFAHNKCLQTVNKCPTCRKQVTKPYLRVDTLVNRRLGWIRENPALYKERLKYFYFCVGVMVLVSLGENTGYLEVHPCIMGVILVFMFTAQFFVILDDSLNKYWLYNDTRKTYY